MKILIRTVRGVTVAQSSPTGNHSNKRMNPCFVRNTIIMLLERALSLHLSPHISKNYSWYMELPLKLFLCICRSFSIEILLFQFLEGSLKITFNLPSSTRGGPTHLCSYHASSSSSSKQFITNIEKRQMTLLWLSSWDSMMSNSIWITQNYRSWSLHEEEHSLFLNCALVVAIRYVFHALCWWEFILPLACQHVLCKCPKNDMIV